MLDFGPTRSPSSDTEQLTGTVSDEGTKVSEQQDVLMTTADHARVFVCAALAFVLLTPDAGLAQASVLSKAVRTSDSMEPALSFPAEEQAAQKKLDELRARTASGPTSSGSSSTTWAMATPALLAAVRRSARPRRIWTGWRARASSSPRPIRSRPAPPRARRS